MLKSRDAFFTLSFSCSLVLVGLHNCMGKLGFFFFLNIKILENFKKK